MLTLLLHSRCFCSLSDAIDTSFVHAHYFKVTDFWSESILAKVYPHLKADVISL